MTIENSGDFYGFKRAGNLDNTPISYPTTETIAPKTQNTHTKNSSASTWMVVFFASVLVAAFCFITFHRNNSSNLTLAATKSEVQSEILAENPQKATESYAVSENDDPEDNFSADNVETVAESYMFENYGDYKFISKEQNGDSYRFHYQIREATEFLAILTPITLSCDTHSEQSDIDFTINTSDPIREWHLNGEWSYSDDISNYYLKINRCEGDILYAEYSFYEINRLDDDPNEIPYADSFNGEISLTVYPDNDEHYYTTDIINLDIYPYGTTLDIGGDGAGINLNGIWLNKKIE